MNKNFFGTLTIAAFCVFLVTVAFPYRVFAAEYFIDPLGADTNTGTKTSPWKTATKAMTSLSPGDTLYLNSGVYTFPIDITKNGTSSLPITVKPTSQTITIDIKNSSNVAVKVSGNYIHVSGINARNSNWAGIQVTGSHVVLDSVTASQTKSHGIIVSGTDIQVKNSSVFETVNENNPASESNGWGSGLKVERGAKQILLENNAVYHNYGEGIASTMGDDVTIRGNHVYDNYSANIYIDNSSRVTVEKNFVTCSTSADAIPFYRAGKPASGILMGEESYTGWGAKLSNVSILNNIIFGCRGISFYGAEVSPGGLKGAMISNNTLWGISGAGSVYIANEPQNTGITISHNIAPGSVTKGSGITVTDNLQTVQFSGTPDTSSINSFRIKQGTPGFGSHGFIYDELPRVTETILPQSNTGDIDGNGVVNLFDYNTLMANYGKSGSPGWIKSDIIVSGAIDIFDYNALLAVFNK